jgi:hypothetical protein
MQQAVRKITLFVAIDTVTLFVFKFLTPATGFFFSFFKVSHEIRR